MARPIRRNYDFAGLFVMLSGLLYIPVFLLDSWNGQTKFFMIFGVIVLLMGLILRGRYRWLAYVAYMMSLVGMLVTLVAMGTSPVGIWWWAIIMILQFLAVFKLFGIIWAPKGEFDK